MSCHHLSTWILRVGMQAIWPRISDTVASPDVTSLRGIGFQFLSRRCPERRKRSWVELLVE